MYSSNLSELSTHEYLFQLLQEEEISFDRMITDYQLETQKENHILLNKHITEIDTFKKIKKSDHILLILWTTDISAFLDDIKTFENLTIIEAFAGISSIWHKSKIRLDHREQIQKSDFELYFPFDQNQFLKILEKEGRNYIITTNQEIPENIYQLPEDEEVSFVDKALAEQPENIALINNPESQTHIIAFGSYFEQRVQLSQLLLQREESYHLSVIAKLSQLTKATTQNTIKKAKKLIIIADHLNTSDFSSFLSKLSGKEEASLQILTPKYEQLTTILPEYQLEQVEFDALALFNRITNQ